MENLLSAGFYRLFKQKLFWLSMAAAAVCNVYVTAATYLMNRGTGEGRYYPLTWVIFEFFMPVVLMNALLCSLIIGGEHENGLLRGKLMMGYRREQVYLANFTVCVSAGLMLAGTYLLLSFTLGAAMMQPPALPLSTLLYDLLLELLAVAAMCSMAAFIAMLLPNRAAAVVACVAALTVMSFAAFRLIEALRAEDVLYLEQPIIGTHETEWRTVRNPSYVSGARRQWYILICDLLPMGQYMQISDYDFSMFGKPLRMGVFSLCEIVGSAAAGAAIFRRQDVK